MARVRMVRHYGITPYLVFDGDFLPSKASTEAARSQRREEGRKLGLELLKAGKTSQAHQELQKAIDITPEMARHLIEALKKAGIPYVVAPYEADAQLVYLERQGITDGIISEDSDLLVFGAKRLITKLDQYGHCVVINRRDFNACREISLYGWDDRRFRQMAILSGCDYLDSIPNLGLKTAYRLLRQHKTVERVVRTLQFEGKHRVPADYLVLFRQAEQTFLYQWAYCPTSKQLVNLTTLPPDLNIDELPFVGSFVEPQLAQRVAAGDVNPITKQDIILPTLPALPALPSPRKRTASGARRRSITPSRSTRGTPKKPINAYFKGHHRKPLAEMDPNCFHVDPERMTGEDAQPIVFPLPRPYIDDAEPTTSSTSGTDINRSETSSRTSRRRTEPVTNLLADDGRSLTSNSRRRISGPEVRASHHPANPAAGINPRPSKKARLCDDIASGLSPGKGKSRFFSSSGPKVQTAAKDEGYLMSDDSIEEALKDLPEMEGWFETPDRRRTITVFEGDRLPLGEPDAPHDNEPVAPDGPPAPVYEPTATIVPDTPPKSTLGRFAYGVNTPSRDSQPSRLPKRQSSMSTTRSLFISPSPRSASSQPSAMRTTPASTPRLTPLQQLEKRALCPTKESPTSKFAVPRVPKRSSLGRMSLDSIPINPAFIALPAVDVAELEQLNGPIGSEDLLVPDSETEDSEAVPGLGNANSARTRTGRKTLDLSQYMFASS